MKTFTRSTVILSVFFFVGVLVQPASAQGNSYSSSKPKWNGDIVVKSTESTVLPAAYVVGQNVPLGQYSLGLAVVNRNDGRTYDKSDEDGKASARIRFFGSLVVWKPGYWPIRYEWNLNRDTSLPVPDANGVLTVTLQPAVEADRSKADEQAAKWLEINRRAPIIRLGRRAKQSAKLRKEVRNLLTPKGINK